MRATGCRAPGFEVLVKRVCQMDMGVDRHKYYMPLMTARNTSSTVFVSVDLRHTHSALFLGMPEQFNRVLADVHWDNFQYPPSTEKLLVCAWCLAHFELESHALNAEEELTNAYNISHGKVPVKCLRH